MYVRMYVYIYIYIYIYLYVYMDVLPSIWYGKIVFVIKRYCR